MKANELQINTFLQAPNVQFVIPVYQRNYDWKTAECNELLQDIIAVEAENRGTHFIGSIVFVHEGTYSTNEVKELVIIDGQQRLTTINILYAALYRFAKDEGMTQDADRLYNMFLINQYVTSEESKLKLKQNDVNYAAFKAILNGTEQSFNLYSNVVENYNFFRTNISTGNFTSILNGLNRLIFVEISLERSKDDPQRIFESLNSTGLDLSQSDLIRNFILMDLPPKDQKKIYETVWQPIEDNAKDLVKQTSLVSDYIRDYLTLRNKKIPNKNKVYAEFKSLYANKKDENFLQELEKIKSLSAQYKKLVNPTTIADVEIKKELVYISRLEINVAYPFLLQVLEDYDNGLLSKADLIKILKLVQSFTWRRFIVGLPTNALNKIFMALYAEIDTEDYYESTAVALAKKKGTVKFPTNPEIKIALQDKDLYNTQPKNRNYFFELLENYNNREYVSTANDDITIEHIFPQQPHAVWQESLSPEEYLAFKDKYINTIANLTLSGNNGSLGNKPFLAKKEMNINGSEQGYEFSRLWLNQYLKTITEWNETTYFQRLELITERFFKIWEYPNVVIDENEDSTEENIFDAEAPTHKRLDYFVFENNRIEEDTVAQMYFYVLRQLLAKNSRLILEGQTVLKITKNEADFRAPQELANGWYIESNIDSNSKFTILKKILVLFELENELFIKYSNEGIVSSNETSLNKRKSFWIQLLAKLEHTTLFNNVSPSKDHWLLTGAGTAGVSYLLTITKMQARIELAIGTADKAKNKSYFNKLLKSKEAIEENFGAPLIWEELPDNKMSRIKTEVSDVNIFDESTWDKMNEFFVGYLEKFVGAIGEYVEKLK